MVIATKVEAVYKQTYKLNAPYCSDSREFDFLVGYPKNIHNIIYICKYIYMYIFHTKCCQSLVTERSVFSDVLENKFPWFSSEGSRTLQSMPFAGFLAHESPLHTGQTKKNKPKNDWSKLTNACQDRIKKKHPGYTNMSPEGW